jgi:hypothetical protein
MQPSFEIQCPCRTERSAQGRLVIHIEDLQRKFEMWVLNKYANFTELLMLPFKAMQSAGRQTVRRRDSNIPPTQISAETRRASLHYFISSRHRTF